jgi:HEAT repeat protein
VPIRPSSGKQIDQLIADLSAGRAVTRDAAIARLTIIGTRGVDRLIAILETPAATSTRLAALRTLEGIADPRALDVVLNVLNDPDDAVACGAVSAVQVFLRSARGADVVDRLTRVALDTHRHSEVRLAAIQALSDLETSTLMPLWKALAQDTNSTVRTKARGAVSKKTKPDAAVATTIDAAARGELPDPAMLKQAIVGLDRSVSLALLHRVLERIREREVNEPSHRRTEWTTARAAAHLALANRGSRLGLYDLRESLEGATRPLPVEFLSALSLIGDSSCLEPIAAAYAKAGGSATDWWAQHLAAVFREIAKRERITPRHAVVKRIAQRWGDAAKALQAGDR